MKKVAAIAFLLLAVTGVVGAITITTTDLCIDGQPLSSLFSDILTKLTEIKNSFPDKTSDGAAICEHVLYDKIREGRAFSVSHRFASVAAGANVTMYFSIPADSVAVNVVAIEVASTGQGYIEIYRYPDVISGGTQLTPINLDFSSLVTSTVVTGYGYTVDLSSATKALDVVLPGGTKVRAVGSLSEVGESVILPPGNSFVVIYTNTAATDEDVSIRIVWFEESVAS